MESGRLANKRLTTTDGVGLTNSATHAFPFVDLPTLYTSTDGNHQYSGEDDSLRVKTGAGGGSAGSSGGNAPRWGYTAPSGSRIEVNDTGGSEHISIVHKTGAGINIEQDGSVHLYSTSARGAGLGAPLGDVYINAGGEIVIKGGGAVSITTAGDLNLNVGGNLNIKCQGFNLITQNYDATVDGAATTSVTNDHSLLIGGIDRKTVAGDAREQVSGKKIIDVGSDFINRVSGDHSKDVKGKSTNTIKGDHTLSSKAKTKILSGSDTSIDTGGTLSTKTTGQTLLDSTGDFLTRAKGYYEIGAGTNIGIGAKGSAIFGSQTGTTSILGNSTTVTGHSLTLGSDGSTKVIGSTTDVSGSIVNINAGVLNATPTGAGGSPETISPTDILDPESPDAPDAPKDAEDAKTMEAKDIVDTLTSARKYPEYPGNGVLESANATGLGMISHSQTKQAEDVFNEYSGGNQGNVNPSQEGGSYTTLPEEPMNRDPNIKAIDPNIDVPSRENTSAKISKYFTLGSIVNAKHSHRIPPAKWDDVVKNHILLANNVLDPVKEKFPDIILTCGYRPDSSNHISGRAIDLVVESRSMSKHAEIARFARDNLPVDQVFLEKNTSGRTHVHLRVSIGSGGNPKVMTCGDPKCHNNQPGIDVNWLSRRAK